MTEQPEALRLADAMLHYWDERGPDAEAVAAELRRLHYLNEARRDTHEALGLRIAALEQAGRQALEALKNYTVRTGKQSLQVEQQEPVAWMQEMPTTGDETRSVRLTTVEALAREEWANPIPLYTAPQRREWVGLTEDEIEQACVPLGAAMLSFTEVARAIETKLKEKNQ